jgi:branched-chain amino acid transport system substrate-binding protein
MKGNIMRRYSILSSLAFVASLALSLVATSAISAEREVKIAGIGAKSTVMRSFGVNTEAVLKAAVDRVNSTGGIQLADGNIGKIVLTFDDERCNAEEGISLLRRIASSDALVVVGPTCSNVAEPLFGILQKKVDNSGDSGLQIPVFTDTAIKGGLAKISEWAFRNTPSESMMYKTMFEWLKAEHPELKSLYGGVEEDFAHSRSTWYQVMKERSAEAGYEVKGESKWLLNDTSFATQVREMKRANADVIAISAHAFTTCGVLKEMKRQRVVPKLLVGLTSSSTNEVMKGCPAEAEGIVIPTSFAPVTDPARTVAKLAEANGGSADLHSAAAWEIIIALKNVIETNGVMAKPETVAADRRKIRDGLASLKEMDGLIGMVQRTPDGEAIKPYVYVNAVNGNWNILHTPNF